MKVDNLSSESKSSTNKNLPSSTNSYLLV